MGLHLCNALKATGAYTRNQLNYNDMVVVTLSAQRLL